MSDYHSQAVADLPLFNQTEGRRAHDDPRAAGERAGELCKAKAEAAGFDSEAAKAVVMAALSRDGEPLSGEQLVNECIAAGIVPHDARAFGPVIASLARAGWITTVGFAARKKGHGTAGARLWKATNEARRPL